MSPPRPAPLRWVDTVSAQLVQSVEQCREEKRKRARPHRTHEYSMLESFKDNTNKGRTRLENFQRAMRFLFSKGVRLGEQQKRLVDEITTALLPKFFEDDLVSNLKWLRKKFGFDEINDTKSMIFPRRSGKTEGCAIVIAALAVSQPKGNCIMYNLTATQAKEFLQSVYRHLKVWVGLPPHAPLVALRLLGRPFWSRTNSAGRWCARTRANTLKLRPVLVSAPSNPTLRR